MHFNRATLKRWLAKAPEAPNYPPVIMFERNNDMTDKHYYDAYTIHILMTNAAQLMRDGLTQDACAMLAIRNYGRRETVGITAAEIAITDPAALAERFYSELLTTPDHYENFEAFARTYISGYYYEVVRGDRFTELHNQLLAGGRPLAEAMSRIGYAQMTKARDTGSWIISTRDVYDWLGTTGPLTGVNVFVVCPGRPDNEIHGQHMWQHGDFPDPTRTCRLCGAKQL